jgi:uncharacterized protein YndB with AHSA1/START domain
MVAKEAHEKGSDMGTKSRASVERTSDRELVVSRTFNGPARIVFDAWTKPELVRRWWAPTSIGAAMVSCEADVRVGGQYRYVFSARGSREMAFSGQYSEITPYTRLVYTTFFEPAAAGPHKGAEAVVVTVTFEERDGKTYLVSRELYPSKDVLEGAIATGMEKGIHIAMDQLDELVVSLA